MNYYSNQAAFASGTIAERWSYAYDEYGRKSVARRSVANGSNVLIPVRGENVFKSFVIAILVENNRTSISSIQGMVDPVLLVSTFRAANLWIITDFDLAVKSPDPFSILGLAVLALATVPSK